MTDGPLQMIKEEEGGLVFKKPLQCGLDIFHWGARIFTLVAW